ncbi:MAG: hypothetical protein HS105_09845 [Chloracidobacterium sp.]|nr:hypothetical protein [Chloracidobacterium sp.]MCO5334908.1 hypothetical protein [Pyrinomonadaceae bacterium]
MTWIYTLIVSGLLFGGNPMFPLTQKHDSSDVTTSGSSAAFEETEKIERTLPLKAGGRVSVANVNGPISITAWDRSEVQIVATKVADSKEKLAEVDVRIDAKPDAIRVESDYERWQSSNGGRSRNIGGVEVRYELIVPRDAVLNEIGTVNGAITLSGLANSTVASVVNGKINATAMGGTAKLSTVNGELVADIAKLDAKSRFSLSTVNGSVSVTIPPDASSIIKASSLNGSISNDLGLTVRKGEYIGRDMNGKLGTGDALIRLDSVNGALSIKRRTDGKPLPPAVDLLTMNGTPKGDADLDGPYLAEFMKNQAQIEANAAKIAEKAAAEAQAGLAQLKKIAVQMDEDCPDTKQLKLKEKSFPTRPPNPPWPMTGPDDRPVKIERKENIFDVTGVPSVEVGAAAASIRVIGWDKPQVSYRALQITDQQNSEPLHIEEKRTDASVKITISGTDDLRREAPSWLWGQSAGASIVVYVPKKTNLKVSSESAIRVEGVAGTLEVEGFDETVDLRDIGGDMTISSRNGNIRLLRANGQVNTRSATGMIGLEGLFTKVDARSDRGDIVITLPPSANADIQARGNDVNFDGFDNMKHLENERSKYTLGSGGNAYTLRTDGSITFRTFDSISARR